MDELSRLHGSEGIRACDDACRTPQQAGKKYIFSPPRASWSSRTQVTVRPLKPLVTEKLQIILLTALDKYTHWVYYMNEVILWTFVK